MLYTYTGTTVAGSWYRNELLKVPKNSMTQTILPTRRILRRRMNRASGEEEVLVRTADGTEQWVTAEAVRNGAIVSIS